MGVHVSENEWLAGSEEMATGKVLSLASYENIQRYIKTFKVYVYWEFLNQMSNHSNFPTNSKWLIQPVNLDSIENPRYNPFDPLWDFTARKSILYIRFAEKKSHGRKHFEAPSNTHTTHAKCIFKRFLAFKDDLWSLTFNHFLFNLSLISCIFAESEKLVLDIVLQIRAL